MFNVMDIEDGFYINNAGAGEPLGSRAFLCLAGNVAILDVVRSWF